MPARLVWSHPEHAYRDCYLVRSYGGIHHIAPETPECHVDMPLPRLCLPTSMQAFAVLDGGRQVLAAVKGAYLEIVDVATYRSIRCQDLEDNHNHGYDVCQTASGQILLIGGYLGTTGLTKGSGLQDSDGAEVLAAAIQARLEDRGAYGANSVSAYGDTIAVGGPDVDRVDVFDGQGRLKRTIGPIFEFQGRTFGLAYGIDAEDRVSGVSGVLVDALERVWLAFDRERVAVFGQDGRCVYVSVPEELIHPPDEGMSVRLYPTYYGSSGWGVDHRGWLWCHGGNAAFEIPELDHLAPALGNAEAVRSGLEPTIGEGAFNADESARDVG